MVISSNKPVSETNFATMCIHICPVWPVTSSSYVCFSAFPVVHLHYGVLGP